MMNRFRQDNGSYSVKNQGPSFLSGQPLKYDSMSLNMNTQGNIMGNGSGTGGLMPTTMVTKDLVKNRSDFRNRSQPAGNFNNQQ